MENGTECADEEKNFIENGRETKLCVCERKCVCECVRESESWIRFSTHQSKDTNWLRFVLRILFINVCASAVREKVLETRLLLATHPALPEELSCCSSCNLSVSPSLLPPAGSPPLDCSRASRGSSSAIPTLLAID